MVQPSRVSIMFDGRIVKEGGPELVERARAQGLRLDQRRGGGGAAADGPSTPTPRSPREFPDARPRGPRLPRQRRRRRRRRASSSTRWTTTTSTIAATRAPRRLPAGRRGDRAASRARASGSRAWLNWDARDDDLHPQRDRGAQPRRRTRGAARTSAPATASSSPRWSTTPTSCRGGCSPRRRARRSRSSASTTTASCGSTSSTRILARGDVKLVAVGHVSNVVGTINPVAEIVAPRARRRRGRRRRRHAGRPADPGRPARDRRRLLRLDRPQGLRPDRRRRPARAPRAARRDAAVARRRPHDRRVSLEEVTRWAELAARSSRPARARSPRASAWAPRSTSFRGSGWTTVRAHERELVAYALERLAEVPGLHDPRPARRRPPRRAGLVHARRHPPARRRRDPRPRGRLRPRRPPLRPAAHEAPRRRRDDAARRSRSTTRARTSTA